MTKVQNPKIYDLEDRCLEFASNVRSFIGMLPRTISIVEDSKQLVRASGSIGANYIEANESLSKKDFSHRIKISRKEAKETRYWLKLIQVDDKKLEKLRKRLIEESTELLKIFSSILNKSK